MYETFLGDIKGRMQPVLDLAETNKRVMEKLASLQQESMTDVVNASVEQFRELAKCKDPKEAMDLQLKFYKSLENKMTSIAEQSVAAITEANEAFASVVEASAKKAAADIEEAVQQANPK